MVYSNQCLKCVGLKCDGSCGRSMTTEDFYKAEEEFFGKEMPEELKGKALAKLERRERQAEQGWRKGWHR